MKVTKTERFVKAEDIKGKLGQVFKILEEPIEVQGDYGKKLECRIKTSNGFAKWSINKTCKDMLIDAFGDETSEWIGEELKVHVENINGKDAIILDQEQF